MDRKEAIRQYKEGTRPMGIWRVRCTATGRELVGSSTDLPAMLNRQRAQLRLGAHREGGLQEDWRAHGESAFTFEVLDTLEPPEAPDADPRQDLVTLLAMWRERLAGPGSAA